MNKVNALVNIVKPVIGLVHLPPLPGTYLNDGSLRLESILQTALEDANNLAEGKIDAMLICNENDKPYTKKAEAHIIAQMTWIAEKIVDEVDLPFGIDVQWDPFASLAIAKATDAAFIRGLVVGTYCGDLGQYSIDPCQFAEYRKKIGAQNIKVFTNLMPEFSYSLDQRPIALRALTAYKSSLVDTICVSGVMAGKLGEVSTLQEVKESVASLPVYVNTGISKDNIAQILEIADGCFVASSIKSVCKGRTQIDANLVKELMLMKGNRE